MRALLVSIATQLSAIISCEAFANLDALDKRTHHITPHNDCFDPHPSSKSSTTLQMGLFDFLNTRQGDFVPLQSNEDVYGPGPCIIMYAVPSGMDDEELRDMVEDGMPDVGGVVIRRVDGIDLDDEGMEDELLDLSVQDALNRIMAEGDKQLLPREINTAIVTQPQENNPCPVFYFSGIANNHMMNTYNILANEIYEETNGVHWPACAKVVEPAMKKSLRQVLSEISGDHADAMRMRREQAGSEESGG